MNDYERVIELWQEAGLELSRRGWVNHLAVVPHMQGKNLGARIMAELENRFGAKGCEKVNLLVEPTNARVKGFYEKLGYNRDE